MQDIKIAIAQFEHRDNDKQFNLAQIESLTRSAAAQGAQFVSFHECAVTGYTFLQHLNQQQLLDIAEPVPKGPSTNALIDIAKANNIIVMAGLVEKDDARNIYNSYITVSPDGFITRFHKLHPFVNPHLTPGAGYNVIELLGCKFGFLICYDNNLPENVRMNALLGAEIVVMPHVTGCTPSPMPGRGVVPPELWHNRHNDPTSLRQQFDGPKHRQWLLKWLPARCFENGVYGVFTNPIGVDGDTIKAGSSMIIDPYGDIITECRNLGPDLQTATLTAEKYEQASGRRYINARRPDLYDKLSQPLPPGTKPTTEPGWKLAFKS